MRYKSILLVVLLAFAISLAVVVGQRLSAEAMAVIVGVVAGVAASIPTSLIVVWVAMRARGSPSPMVEERPAAPPEPRIVVMPATPAYAQPAGPQLYAPAAALPGMPYAPAMPRAANRRQFTVIGGVSEVDI